MAQFYEMPAVSPTMELGTLVSWRIKPGERFEPQAIIAEVGTDKANVEVEIFDAGVLLKHLIGEGDEAPAGFPIAIVGQKPDEDITALVAEFEKRRGELAAGTAAHVEEEEPATETVEPKARVEKPAPTPPAPGHPASTPARSWMGKQLSSDFMDPPGDARLGVARARWIASPLARRVAEEKGIDLRRIQGTGPGGRILRADVEQAPLGGGRPTASRADETHKLTPMRKTIAKRLLASHQDIPTFFLTVSMDGRGFVDLRSALKKHDPESKISYNDLMIACVARTLRDFPPANATWGEKEIVRYGRVDVGVAVALPEGLITPVLRGVDQLSIAEIAAQVRELVGRAREGKLKPEEYTGGTFTISNLGMYDISHFTAIINPPEAAILAVGSIAQVPVVTDGELAVGWRMNCTMTCDHRVIDGAIGAQFLQILRKTVEAPALLLM